MRRRLLWLLVAPLALAGSQGAHWLAYRLVAPDAHEREHLLAETGHAYLAYGPAVGGVAAALVVAALALRVTAELRRGRAVPGARLAAWPFALIPVLGFVAQEYIERLAHDHTIPLHAYADRTFVLGVALQAPFALAAYLLARVLLAAAARVVRLLRRLPRPRSAALLSVLRVALVRAARPAALAGPGAGRGPPLAALR